MDLALFLLAYSQGINFKTYGATGNKFFKFLFFFLQRKGYEKEQKAGVERIGKRLEREF